MSYILRIRNRDGVIPDLLYRTYKSLQHFNVVPLPIIYNLLAFERSLRCMVGGWIKRKFYDEPLFKLRCAKCGHGLHLEDGIPVVYGNVQLSVGNQVTLHGTSTITGAKVFQNPKITIGDRSHCGSNFTASAGADIYIGSDVLIGNRVSILSYDHHPIDSEKRRLGLPAEAETSRPIFIDDGVWICPGSYIMKGVRIGKGSIVGAGSVVVHDVPSAVIVAGNPAKIVKKILPFVVDKKGADISAQASRHISFT